ncbi:hypothetical protein BT67DRAFT_431612 [Trichocladium antarcticum]|uniref:Uncharacterized protein n=1 Tax=Trichocladium antarcticum TaxID=1450529 RepID=A0AAN6ZH11_9PEZI|nr:hypothetical protein BT67DRAFT_431612 [Trichocladium antarcticum]
MDASSRGPAPSPLRIGPFRANDAVPVPRTPGSAGSGTSSAFPGDDCASPASASSSAAPLMWDRKGSLGPASPGSSATRPALQRKVNANSYCGRHSDEFLFGGKGLGDLWKAVTTKK